jgi:hypothetical protein
MKLASKSKNRIAILDMIQDGISTQDVFENIDYKKESEDKIKKLIYPNLLNRVTEFVMEKRGFNRSLAREKAKTMVKLEGDSKNTVKNTRFMGTDNMPNMSLDISGVKVAIEFKKVNRGSGLREAIGQSLIYSTVYDFVIYMLIDTSENDKIIHGSTAVTEESFLEDIWEDFNVKFVIV